MLKTTKPRKGGVGVSDNTRAGHGRSKIDRSGIDNVEVDGIEVEVDELGKKGRKTFKSKNLCKSKKTVILDFLTLRAKIAFTELRQAFFKAPILHHFDPEYYNRIEMNESGYAIGGVLSQLTSDNSG